jgi:hypothetical protein
MEQRCLNACRLSLAHPLRLIACAWLPKRRLLMNSSQTFVRSICSMQSAGANSRFYEGRLRRREESAADGLRWPISSVWQTRTLLGFALFFRHGASPRLATCSLGYNQAAGLRTGGESAWMHPVSKLGSGDRAKAA